MSGAPDPGGERGVPAAPQPPEDPWQALRRFTAARIALGRAGVSLPTARHLEFSLAHARARDAVHAPFAAQQLADALAALGARTVSLHAAAADRSVYLQRPDLGRRLDAASLARLQALPAGSQGGFDVAFVVADGLSPQAVERHAPPLLAHLLPALAQRGRSVAPVAIVHQGRVAVGDEVGALLGARAVVVMIGERPGLSSPDSLGLYLTWAPRCGLTDAARNCISNVRPEGLACEAAAHRLLWLLDEARARGLSGVALKDETVTEGTALGRASSFLLPDA